MNTISLVTRAAQDAEGPSLPDILSNIPRDPASVFVYLLVLVAAVFIWIGSRKRD